MPTAVDGLTKSSSPDQIKKAISQCISTEIGAGRERDQAVAMCYSTARKKTGRGNLLSAKK